MEKKKDGFPNEKAIVIPQEILLKVQKNPMTSLLYPTDIGYYPHAENHYRQREEGSEQHILIYCHEGEGWYDIGKGRCTIKKNQFFIIEAGTPHTYAASAQHPWSIYWVHFAGEKAASLPNCSIGPVISMTHLPPDSTTAFACSMKSW